MGSMGQECGPSLGCGPNSTRQPDPQLTAGLLTARTSLGLGCMPGSLSCARKRTRDKDWGVSPRGTPGAFRQTEKLMRQREKV